MVQLVESMTVSLALPFELPVTIKVPMDGFVPPVR
jgi:hypothetical protein